MVEESQVLRRKASSNDSVACKQEIFSSAVLQNMCSCEFAYIASFASKLGEIQPSKRIRLRSKTPPNEASWGS